MHTERTGPEQFPEERPDYARAEPAQRRDGHPAVARRSAELVSTIEGEIVPRLLMHSRRASGAHAGHPAAGSPLEPDDIDELARLLLAHGPGVACEYVEAIRQRGTPYERICLDLLAPAALRLVDGWEREACSYPELTRSLAALHAVVLEVSAAARSDRPIAQGG